MGGVDGGAAEGRPALKPGCRLEVSRPLCSRPVLIWAERGHRARLTVTPAPGQILYRAGRFVLFVVPVCTATSEKTLAVDFRSPLPSHTAHQGPGTATKRRAARPRAAGAAGGAAQARGAPGAPPAAPSCPRERFAMPCGPGGARRVQHHACGVCELLRGRGSMETTAKWAISHTARQHGRHADCLTAAALALAAR